MILTWGQFLTHQICELGPKGKVCSVRILPENPAALRAMAKQVVYSFANDIVRIDIAIGSASPDESQAYLEHVQKIFVGPRCLRVAVHATIQVRRHYTVGALVRQPTLC